MISLIKNGLNKLKIKKKKQKINYLLLKDILFQTTQLYGKKLFLKIISPLKTSLFVKSKINWYKIKKKKKRNKKNIDKIKNFDFLIENN
jgi:hypothetical protein